MQMADDRGRARGVRPLIGIPYDVIDTHRKSCLSEQRCRHCRFAMRTMRTGGRTYMSLYTKNATIRCVRRVRCVRYRQMDAYLKG